MTDGYTRAILRAQEDVNALGADLEELRRAIRRAADRLIDPTMTVGQRERLCEDVATELRQLACGE